MDTVRLAQILHLQLVDTLTDLLQVVSVIDQTEAWRRDGAASLEGWLRSTFGLSPQTAAQWAGTARSKEPAMG